MTTESTRPDAEPVAWMYTHDSTEHKIPFLVDHMDPLLTADKGWTETPLFAHPPQQADAGVVEALEDAVRAMRFIKPYLEWAVGPESLSHHPTMPSAVGAFIDSFVAASLALSRAQAPASPMDELQHLGQEFDAASVSQSIPPEIDQLIHESMAKDFARRDTLTDIFVQEMVDYTPHLRGCETPEPSLRQIVLHYYKSYQVSDAEVLTAEYFAALPQAQAAGDEKLREALEQAEETLDQILDDMRGDGQCVCLAVKEETIETLFKVRAALRTEKED